MILGLLFLELAIPESYSLKDKRKVLKSIIERTRNRFNASVAEVGANEIWNRAELGMAFVGNDQSFLNSCMDHALSYIDSLGLAEIVDQQMEIVHYESEDFECETSGDPEE